MYYYNIICRGEKFALAIPKDSSLESQNDHAIIISLEQRLDGTYDYMAGVSCDVPKVVRTGTVVSEFTDRATTDEELGFWFSRPETYPLYKEQIINL